MYKKTFTVCVCDRCGKEWTAEGAYTRAGQDLCPECAEEKQEMVVTVDKAYAEWQENKAVRLAIIDICEE